MCHGLEPDARPEDEDSGTHRNPMDDRGHCPQPQENELEAQGGPVPVQSTVSESWCWMSTSVHVLFLVQCVWMSQHIVVVNKQKHTNLGFTFTCSQVVFFCYQTQ
jgi:hypothetical protein